MVAFSLHASSWDPTSLAGDPSSPAPQFTMRRPLAINLSRSSNQVAAWLRVEKQKSCIRRKSNYHIIIVFVDHEKMQLLSPVAKNSTCSNCGKTFPSANKSTMIPASCWIHRSWLSISSEQTCLRIGTYQLKQNARTYMRPKTNADAFKTQSSTNDNKDP